jgi:ribosomal-protein-alanine N-acetyltransferase
MSYPGHHLRQARTADLDAILALERATEHAPHWPLSAYAAILESQQDPEAQPSTPRRCLLVAETLEREPNPKAALAGFVVAQLPPSVAELVAELESIAVAASARRSGIGRALCLAALDWCRTQGAISVLLEVRASSAPAIALYTSLGFLPAARRPRYYANPDDDALILRIDLT